MTISNDKPLTDSAPLLQYGLSSTPDPLQVSTEGTLELVVSNGTGDFITCTQIVLILPVGGEAPDLTASAEGIQTTAAPGWGVTATGGGVFMLTPIASGADSIGADGLTFTFAWLRVNSETGTCEVTVIETASGQGQGSQDRQTAFPLLKVPVTFSLSGLAVSPLEVESGGSTTLSWTGTDASYALSYDPDGQGTQRITVEKTGPYTTTWPLTAAPSITFTLAATFTNNQGEIQVVQKQAAVAVRLAKPKITKFQGQILPATGSDPLQLLLTWVVEGPERMTVAVSWDSNAKDPSGSMTVALPVRPPLASSYTLTATNEVGATDSSTLQVGNLRRGTPIAVGRSPMAVAVSPDGTRVYVVNSGDSTVSVINAMTLQVIGSPISVGFGPWGLAVSPDSARVFVANGAGRSVSVIDATTLQVIGSPIDVGDRPSGVAVSLDGKYVFVGNAGEGTVSVIDAQALTFVRNLDLGGGLPDSAPGCPMGVAVSPDGKYVFAASSGRDDDRVYVLDAQAPTTASAILVNLGGPFSVAVSPDSKRLFVTNSYDHDVTVIAVARHERLGDGIEVGNGPGGAAVSPDGTSVFVTAMYDGTVHMIDATTLQPVGWPISVGGAPNGVAISPDGRHVFVGNNSRDVTTLAVLTVDVEIPGGVSS